MEIHIVDAGKGFVSEVSVVPVAVILERVLQLRVNHNGPRISHCWGEGGSVTDTLQDVSASGRLFLSKGGHGGSCQVGGFDCAVDMVILR